MQMIKIRPKDEKVPWLIDKPENIHIHLTEGEPDEMYEIVMVELTDEEISKMPEFTGW